MDSAPIHFYVACHVYDCHQGVRLNRTYTAICSVRCMRSGSCQWGAWAGERARGERGEWVTYRPNTHATQYTIILNPLRVAPLRWRGLHCVLVYPHRLPRLSELRAILRLCSPAHGADRGAEPGLAAKPEAQPQHLPLARAVRPWQMKMVTIHAVPSATFQSTPRTWHHHRTSCWLAASGACSRPSCSSRSRDRPFTEKYT